MFGHSEQPRSDAESAFEYAQRAVTLDDELALSHSALGMSYALTGKHDQSIEAAQRAVELQPGDTDGYMYLNCCQLVAGLGEEARDAMCL